MRIKVKDANEDVIEIEENNTASVELSDSELAGLRKLLPIANKLSKLVSKDSKEEILEDEDEDEDETINDEDEEVEDEEEEEEVEVEDKKSKKKKMKKDSTTDAFKMHKKTKTHDSLDKDLAISDAWAKRYGG